MPEHTVTLPQVRHVDINFKSLTLFALGLCPAVLIWVLAKVSGIKVWRVDKYALGSFIARMNVMLMDHDSGSRGTYVLLWPSSPSTPMVRQQICKGVSRTNGIYVFRESNWCTQGLARLVQLGQNSASRHRILRKLLPPPTTNAFGETDAGAIVLPRRYSCVAQYVHVEERSRNSDLHEVATTRTYACINVRDRSWDDSLGGDALSQDYRNGRFDDYLRAFEFISSQGFNVIRTGRSSYSSTIRADWFYDYSASAEADDLTDVWLYKNCAFCIEFGNSGVQELGVAFDKPTLSLNFAPLGNWWAVNSWMVVPAVLYKKETGELASLEEYFFLGTAQEDIDRAGYFFAPNPIPIVISSISEFLRYLQHPSDIYSSTRKLQHRALAKIKDVYVKKGCHNADEIAHHYRLSPAFLRTYSHALGLSEED